MKTITHDFSGDYDYPAEEAAEIINDFQYMLDSGDYSKDELHQKLIRERMHWIKVFGADEQGKADMKKFAEVFNEAMAEKLGFAI